MSPESEQRIRASWAKLESRTDYFADTFYARLFDVEPQVRAMFATTDMAAHRQKFVDMLRHLVDALDDAPDLVATLAASGRRHFDYGVRDAHYPVVGAVLLWSLEQCLGSDLDADTRHAWRELYTLIAAIMRRGADQGRAVEPHAS